jgi:hypothetical protein
MNFRKLLNILNIFCLAAITLILFHDPEYFFLVSIILFGSLTIIEILYFSYEYFSLIKTNKVFIVQTRFHFFNLETVLVLVIILAYIYASIKYYNQINKDPLELFIVSTIYSIREMLFNKLKNSVRIDSEKILTENLFHRDIWLNEIVEATIDTKLRSLTLTLMDNKTVRLRLKQEFYEEQYRRIQKFTELINNVA